MAQHGSTFVVAAEGKMTGSPGGSGGPRLRAVDPWLPGSLSPGKSHQLLSDDERARLATIASIVRFKKESRYILTVNPERQFSTLLAVS